jgi:hypothetical protein
MNLKLKTINLKKDPTLTEKWVQEQIADDPSILGLGDLILRDKERIQTSSGRLDLLLQDAETLKRYEVEIQLGSVDESHIIRTVEYWDIERKRYPQYEHAAVIIAEEITSRFLNVIQLFNGAIPLIALKMTAYRVGDQTALTFVKVLDEISYGLVEEDEPVAEPTDRSFWEKKGSRKSLEIVDKLMEIVTEVEPQASLKYNRHYIGLYLNGAAFNFINFRPQKSSLVMKFKLPKTKEYDEIIENSGLEVLPYEGAWKQYRLRVEPDITDEQRAAILELATQAKASFRKNS